MTHRTLFVLERVTLPDIEPVTLTEAKVSMRAFASVTTEDDWITSLITSGRQWAEDYTGRAFIDQTWRLTINADIHRWGIGSSDLVRGWFPIGAGGGLFGGSFVWHRLWEVMLRKAPVLAIESFVMVDSAGNETDVDPTTWQLREQASKWPRIAMINGALAANVTYRLTFRAGFADRSLSPQQGAEMVPENFKTAIKLWVQAHYDRDPVTMPLLLQAAENLLDRERSELGIA